MRFPDHARARLQALNEVNLLDTCQRLVYTPGPTDPYNKPEETYVLGDVLPCRVNVLKTQEVMGSTQIVMTDGTLTLALGTPIDARDHLRILTVMGRDITPADYMIVGAPKEGAASLILNIQLVTTS